MKTNQIIGIVLIGMVGYMLFQKKSQPSLPTWYNPNQVPPMPPQNTPGWMQWANAIISTFGAASWLWSPGGPFHKTDPKEIYDALPNPGAYDWNDPNSLPTG